MNPAVERPEHDRRLLVALVAAVLAMVVGVGAGVDTQASTGRAEVAGTAVAAHDVVAGLVVELSDDVRAGQGRGITTLAEVDATGSRVAPNTAVRGGAGPVRQGAAGVQRTIDDLEAAGGRVLGREVIVDVAGVRTRPDLFAELPCGTRCFLEVKTGPGAGSLLTA